MSLSSEHFPRSFSRFLNLENECSVEVIHPGISNAPLGIKMPTKIAGVGEMKCFRSIVHLLYGRSQSVKCERVLVSQGGSVSVACARDAASQGTVLMFEDSDLEDHPCAYQSADDIIAYFSCMVAAMNFRPFDIRKAVSNVLASSLIDLKFNEGAKERLCEFLHALMLEAGGCEPAVGFALGLLEHAENECIIRGAKMFDSVKSQWGPRIACLLSKIDAGVSKYVVYISRVPCDAHYSLVGAEREQARSTFEEWKGKFGFRVVDKYTQRASCDEESGGWKCSVCMEDEADNEDETVCISACGHSFHTSCVVGIILRSGEEDSKCPMCRKVFVEHAGSDSSGEPGAAEDARDAEAREFLRTFIQSLVEGSGITASVVYET